MSSLQPITAVARFRFVASIKEQNSPGRGGYVPTGRAFIVSHFHQRCGDRVVDTHTNCNISEKIRSLLCERNWFGRNLVPRLFSTWNEVDSDGACRNFRTSTRTASWEAVCQRYGHIYGQWRMRIILYVAYITCLLMYGGTCFSVAIQLGSIRKCSPNKVLVFNDYEAKCIIYRTIEREASRASSM